jgi:MFS family permease
MENQYPHFRWLVMIAAIIGYITIQITNLCIAPILPQIAENLKTNLGDVTNLMAAFLFSGSIALLFAGIVADRFGVIAASFIGLACAAVPASLMPLIGIPVAFFANWYLQTLYGLTPSFLSAAKPIGAGFGPITSGQLMLGVMIAGIIGPVSGLLTDKTFRGNVKPVIVVGFLLCCIFIYLIQSPMVYSTIPLLLSTLVLAGIGVEFVFPGMYTYIAKACQLDVVGKMTGLWSGVGAIGGVLGLLLGGIAVNKVGNYSVAIILIACAGLTGWSSAFYCLNRRCEIMSAVGGIPSLILFCARTL